MAHGYSMSLGGHCHAEKASKLLNSLKIDSFLKKKNLIVMQVFLINIILNSVIGW